MKLRDATYVVGGYVVEGGRVLLLWHADLGRWVPAGGRIEIRLWRDGNELHWSIRDSGIGISEESQKRLFEKFFRADNAHTIDTEGTGLGLYLVRLIIERLGGTITCESEVGRGTLFHFTLPITAGDTP